MVKTATEGKVTYEMVEMSNIGSYELLQAGKLIAAVIPDDWAVSVTAGPWRMQDVFYDVQFDKKRVLLDFYSVRPGLGYMNEVVSEVKAHIEKWLDNS